MPKVHPMGWDGNGTRGLYFWCPACNERHAVTESKGEGGWTFNGDVERPTFTPSILVRSGHYMEGHSGECWCTYNAKHPDNPAPFTCSQCHSHVTDGKIQYSGDCTHALAGQIVELPDLED